MPQPEIDLDQPVDPVCWIFAAFISGLFFVRWWQPTEGTIQGDTLGIVLGWFFALALSGWMGLRGAPARFRSDRLQRSVWLLSGGHLLAGGIVIATSGDKRAALNLMWEWLALLVAFPMLRRILASAAARREWTIIAIGAVVTLSAYAVIQRIYIYPQTIAEYRAVRDQLDAAEQQAAEAGSAGPDYQMLARIQSLQAKLLKQGLQPQMLGGPSRLTFEGRLLHSTESLGRFALANTFAGLLLVWVIILLLQTVLQLRVELAKRQPTLAAHPESLALTNPRPLALRYLELSFLLLCLGLISYAFLSTKSRTAYLATVIGLTYWSASNGLQLRPRLRQTFSWSLIGLSAIAVMIAIAGLTGSLDRLILVEAPKSLQYRLEYWWSSLQVISESPLFGIGPGQFRQHYLVHKLPQSSEEIADPHNLFLDAWANGGLLALAGLVLLIVEMFRRTAGANPSGSRYIERRDKPLESETIAAVSPVSQTVSIPIGSRVSDSHASSSGKNLKRVIPRLDVSKRSAIRRSALDLFDGVGWRNPFRIGALCSLLVLWLTGGGLETTLLIFATGWLVSIEILDRSLSIAPPGATIWKAAGCGLVVHLLGAGGIAMPAITQLLLVIAILSQPTEPESIGP